MSDSSSTDLSDNPLLWPAALTAAFVPTLLALHQSPSTTLLNQCAAIATWGGLVAVLAPGRALAAARGAWSVLLALALVGAAALCSWLWGALPMSLSLQAVGMVVSAGVMVMAGVQAARQGAALPVFTAVGWGLLVSGLAGAAVAFLQVFAPGWADGDWIANSGLNGIAVGNLRQPNHLCSLLMWAMVAGVALHAMGQLGRLALWMSLGLLVWAMELTASRTGAAGLVVLMLWGLLDKRLPRSARWALVGTPLLYVLAYGAMAAWGHFTHHALGAGARAAAEGGLGDLATGTGSPNSRPNVWRTAWALVLANPWGGVGFGEFNFAWSLTAFERRPTSFFDHTHNLPLQLAVELGLPLALLIMGLITWALWRGWRITAALPDDLGVAGRACLVLVLLVMMHSMVEYPLWYAYFLLPAALVWGLALGLDPAQAGTLEAPVKPARSWGLWAGVLLAVGGALALLDYQKAVVIYSPPPGSGSLDGRIAQGQGSVLFAHHADYAAATNEAPAGLLALGLARTAHSLIDTRLMIAWATYLADNGQVDRARWLAQRLREFRNPDADEFFEPCKQGNVQAFQCQAPQAVHDWREFRVTAQQALKAQSPASAAKQAASAPDSQPTLGASSASQ